MTLTIPDDVSNELRRKAPQALIELACRLYSADRLTKHEAARLCGLSRGEFEQQLSARGLPWIRLNWDETYEREFESLRKTMATPANGKGS